MRAVTFSKFGGSEVIEVKELPEREPGPGQVRIRVAAATVNPTDIGFRSGRQAAMLGGLEPPYIPGMELAGTVDKAGEGSEWQPGDRVLAIVIPRRPEGGAMAESVVVPSASVTRIPEGVSMEQAATLPMNGLTVRLALDKLALKPGDTLAVTGAAGAVGAYAVELGVADGLRVIAVASPGDEAMLKKMGAEAVVPRGDDAMQRIRELVPAGVDGLDRRGGDRRANLRGDPRRRRLCNRARLRRRDRARHHHPQRPRRRVRREHGGPRRPGEARRRRQADAAGGRDLPAGARGRGAGQAHGRRRAGAVGGGVLGDIGRRRQVGVFVSVGQEHRMNLRQPGALRLVVIHEIFQNCRIPVGSACY